MTPLQRLLLLNYLAGKRCNADVCDHLPALTQTVNQTVSGDVIDGISAPPPDAVFRGIQRTVSCLVRELKL